jgi:hypothetical protein
MYDILFIDDKFDEIKDTFTYFQKEHIRCFYSDGENYLPTTKKERLPFKNLKYISLDLHLENRGITNINNKTALSTLSSIIKSFINNNENITIIANTVDPDVFGEKDFCRYLEFSPKIEKVKKIEGDRNKNYSSLHNADIQKEISRYSHKEILRNVVIREAIEVENAIFRKIQQELKNIVNKLSNTKLDKIKKFDFKAKIILHKLATQDDSLETKLDDLRELRNKFAHSDNPPPQNLLDFLNEIENLKTEINHDK